MSEMNYPYKNVGKPDASGRNLVEEFVLDGDLPKETKCVELGNEGPIKNAYLIKKDIEGVDLNNEGKMKTDVPKGAEGVDSRKEDNGNKIIDDTHYAIPKPILKSQSSADGRYDEDSKSTTGLESSHEKDTLEKSKTGLQSSHSVKMRSEPETNPKSSHGEESQDKSEACVEANHGVVTQNELKAGTNSPHEVDTHNKAEESTEPKDKPVATKARLQKYKKCSQHTLEDVVFFCMPCEEQICQRCLVPKHLKHDVNNLEDVALLFRAKIQEKLKLAEKQSATWNRDLNTLKDMRTSFQITLDQEYDKISKCATTNADRICSEGTRLMNELDAAAQLVKDAIAKDKTKLQNQMDRLRSALESCKSHAELTKDVSNHNLLKQQKVILEELTQQCNCSTVVRLQQDKNVYPAIHFEERSSDDTLSLGKIVMAPELRLSQELDGIGLAASIARASTGDFLVADEEGCEVLVYRKQDGLYKKDPSPFNFSESPLGVAVTTDNQYLVSTKDSIMTFSACGDWLPNFTSCLSKSRYLGPLYTSNDRLFGGHIRSPFITEFDIAGDPIRTIHMLHTPRRFVLVDDTKMAVCYHDVSGVDIIQFEKQLGKEVAVLQHLDIRLPLSLCFDDKSNCLFIGHCERSKNPSELRSKRYIIGTGIIDQYCCSSWQFLGRLATGLHSPLCMKMVAEDSLAVADGKTVKLYHVQHRSV